MKTIDRTMRVRGKTVHVQELSDVVAVKRTPIHGARRARPEPALDALATPEAVQQMRAFEGAGWTFMPRKEGQVGAKVYLRRGGRMALGTNRLVVRLAGEAPIADAGARLAERGLHVVEELRMAPNLFVVELAADADPFDVAEALVASGLAEFAEPELIERLGGR